jgi:hypothetical protein
VFKSLAENRISLNVAYGDKALKKSAVFIWYIRFIRISVRQELSRPGVSRNNENVASVWTNMTSNQCVTIVQRADETGI